jgi:hypothetical protein
MDDGILKLIAQSAGSAGPVLLVLIWIAKDLRTRVASGAVQEERISSLKDVNRIQAEQIRDLQKEMSACWRELDQLKSDKNNPF